MYTTDTFKHLEKEKHSNGDVYGDVTLEKERKKKMPTSWTKIDP